ncbi:MAG: class I SAM-dependent methyltransferase [Lutibacter sp.]|uniref:class I SAM-dependent methyltransferase n=1 Tax=Lutibacter sp. TaxID=1925666 RepID=UPI001810041C|nr:class I SAM-dependent methyltransferase [Lutibacter sp.]MBT8317161.1 class I SAM-dependent methyltransferase [Lutibacter sp.]NNJ58021.1 class I SAM-dependent methyltransferase [Lutibacter sp.]
MNTTILNKEIQEYINANLKSDMTKLILKGTNFDEVTTQEIAEQIVSKNKCKTKLPTWFQKENIYYPNKLNIEQTSSEITANYKANLVSGNSLIDITGGFGVDTYYFSKKIKNITHCEINQELSKIVSHNNKQFNLKNIETFVGNGLSYLEKSDSKFDWIYSDPSRRNDRKGKVFLLQDCLPNIPENLELLFKKTDHILLKISPMLDISSAINELNFVKEIHVVSVENEVKELLFILEKNYIQHIDIKTINFNKNNIQTFDFNYQEELVATYSEPKKYLFEPNSAILKAGAFNQISAQLKIDKLHQHSHLYTSTNLSEFPGRSFQIKHVISYNKKELTKLIPSKKANITTRNFPETVSQIRKKTNLKEGGNDYLFFTTNLHNKHIVIICEKV